MKHVKEMLKDFEQKGYNRIILFILLKNLQKIKKNSLSSVRISQAIDRFRYRSAQKRRHGVKFIFNFSGCNTYFVDRKLFIIYKPHLIINICFPGWAIKIKENGCELQRSCDSAYYVMYMVLQAVSQSPHCASELFLSNWTRTFSNLWKSERDRERTMDPIMDIPEPTWTPLQASQQQAQEDNVYGNLAQ